MAEPTQAAAAPAEAAEAIAPGLLTDDSTAIERIASLLDDAGDEIKRPEAPAKAAEGDRESPEPGDAEPPEAAIGDEGADEPELPAIDPPVSWDKAAKEEFKALPRHLQQTVVEREKARDTEFYRKQAEVAEQRKAVEAEQSKIAADRSGYVQKLDAFLNAAGQQFQDEFASIDWKRLAAEDPAAYVLKEFEFKQKQSALQSAAAERTRLENEAATERATAQTEYLTKQQQLLVEAVPEFGDPEKAPKLREQLVTFLQSNGYTPKEISGLTDHRMVKILAQAAKDAEQVKLVKEQRAKTATKVAAAPPKVAEPTKPAPGKEEQSSQKSTALKRQLSKETRTDRQAEILAQIL